MCRSGDGRGGGCATGKMQSCPENTSVVFATCVVQQLRPRYRYDVVGGRLHRQFCLHGTLRS